MRYALMLAVAAAGLAVATSADAQTYLSWPGRAPQAANAASAAAPSGLIPHAGVQPMHNPVGDAVAAIPDRRPDQGLTPASAWLPATGTRPTSPPPPAPVQTRVAATPTPQPARVAAPPPQPAAQRPTPAPPAPQPQAARTPVPEVTRDAGAAPAYDPADPMAPRRDALIFRVGRDQPAAAQPPSQTQAPSAAVQPAAARPQAPQPVAYAATPASPLGTRRYSVHRQNGQQPDAIQRPAPVYLDALPIDLTEAPQSEDLAAPPTPTPMIRNADGRYVPAPAAVEHDVQ